MVAEYDTGGKYMNCLKMLPEVAHSHLMFLSVLNIFLSISAALGNILILVALRKETSLHPPSKLLYRNLAITDLCVGIIVEPAAGLYWISEATEWWDICQFVFNLSSVTGFVLCSVSLTSFLAKVHSVFLEDYASITTMRWLDLIIILMFTRAIFFHR